MQQMLLPLLRQSLRFIQAPLELLLLMQQMLLPLLRQRLGFIQQEPRTFQLLFGGVNPSLLLSRECIALCDFELVFLSQGFVACFEP